MSIKIRRTIILKMNPKEYELLMYIRTNGIDLSNLAPGSLVFHYDENRIRKHELHLFPKRLVVDNSDLTKI